MGADRDRGRRAPGAGLSLLAARARRVRDRLGHSAHRLRDPAADAGVESRGDDGSGTLRAAERFHGGPALAAVLRRLLRGAHANPDHVLPRADLRRGDPVRHRRRAARRAGTPAQRSLRALHRRRSPGAPSRHPGSAAHQRRPRGDLALALRPRGRCGVVSGGRARRAEGRVRVCAVSCAVLRAVLLPQELRLAGLPLAAARWGHRAGAGGDRPSFGRPHARSSVTARRASRERARRPGRRLLLLAGAHRPGTRARGRLGPDAGAALDQEAQDHRSPHGRADLPEPRSRLLEDGQAGARRVSLGALAPAAAAGAPRDLRALLARLAQPDGDRLLSARHALAAASALERSALAPTHRRLDRLARASAVPRHSSPPFVATARARLEAWVAWPRRPGLRTPDQSSAAWPRRPGLRTPDQSSAAWPRRPGLRTPDQSSAAWPRRPGLRTPDQSSAAWPRRPGLRTPDQSSLRSINRHDARSIVSGLA